MRRKTPSTPPVGSTTRTTMAEGLWLKDAAGWFLVRNLCGIEWSAQFCADPAKVDQLRQAAKRLYARFPEGRRRARHPAPAGQAHHDGEGRGRLDRLDLQRECPPGDRRAPRGTAEGRRNPSLPLPGRGDRVLQVRRLPALGDRRPGWGSRGYPCRATGSGDGRTRVVATEPGSSFHKALTKAWHKKRPLTLPA